MSAIGSLRWAQATKGRMRLSDRLKLTAQALAARIERRFGVRSTAGAAMARIDVDAIRWPDSAAAKHAFEQCFQLSPLYMANHSARTYLWGCLFAMPNRERYDEEALFVASMLHDIGLTDKFRERFNDCVCFAVAGAFAAREVLTGLGWPHGRIDTVAEAIALHLNVRLPRGTGPEARLLHAGAGCDVIGAGLRSIPQEARNRVIERYPRDGFKGTWAARMDREASAQPQTRIGFYFRRGFRGMILNAPFKD